MASDDQTLAEAVRTQLETHYPELEWVIVQQTDVRGQPVLTYRGRKKGSSQWASGAYSDGSLLHDTSAMEHLAATIVTDVQEQLKGYWNDDRR